MLEENKQRRKSKAKQKQKQRRAKSANFWADFFVLKTMKKKQKNQIIWLIKRKKRILILREIHIFYFLFIFLFTTFLATAPTSPQ
jgi:hypothetical protein